MKNVKSSTIDRIKAGFAKKLFRKREVNKRRSGEKQTKRLSCFSSPFCVITALFSLQWQTFHSTTFPTLLLSSNFVTC